MLEWLGLAAAIVALLGLLIAFMAGRGGRQIGETAGAGVLSMVERVTGGQATVAPPADTPAPTPTPVPPTPKPKPTATPAPTPTPKPTPALKTVVVARTCSAWLRWSIGGRLLWVTCRAWSDTTGRVPIDATYQTSYCTAYRYSACARIAYLYR